MSKREIMKDKKRVVVKIGSSSLMHAQTGGQDLIKMERLVRELTDMRNSGMDVILVSSGAIAVGKKAVGIEAESDSVAVKQACAAIGQARLMMTYQKLFAEYNQLTAQVLMTKDTVLNTLNRTNAHNTFTELLKLGVIPVVNENDTVATYEIEFGDNDSLSAVVCALVDADLLILLSDIDGLFTDDPHTNKNACFIETVNFITDELMEMGKESTGSKIGTGGMSTKLNAARIATSSGADMIIANGEDVSVIHKIMQGENIGTLFLANEEADFSIENFMKD